MPARFVTWSCPVSGKNFVHNCKAAVEIGSVLARRGVALRQAKAGISGNSDVTGPVLACNGVFKASEGRDWWEFGCYRSGFGVHGRCFKASESRFDDVRKIHTSGIGKEFKEEDMILYIDPSVTTNIIQVIAAVVIAGGAVISVIWRKAKKKVNKVLNIDENKGKEVEAGIESDDLD